MPSVHLQCGENCKRIVFIILLTASFSYGRYISRNEDNSDRIDSNCYIDELLAKIRTSMSSLDPVELKKSQHTNDKGFYAFSETTLRGLSTLHRTGDSVTKIVDGDKIITVNLTANRLVIDGTLRAEDALNKDLTTTGKVTGELDAPQIKLVIRVSSDFPVLESYRARRHSLIDTGRFTGYRTGSLDDVINEAMDFGFEVLYSMYVRDIVENDLKAFIRRIVEQSTYNSFTY